MTRSVLKQFAEWLSTTSPSVFLQNNNAWAIPVIQSIHIVGIAAVFGAAFMLYLRVFGLGGMDQTLRESVDRYCPWLTKGLWLMLATGALLVIAEPVRELVTFSFWAKMLLVATMAVLALRFQGAVEKRGDFAASRALKTGAIVTFLMWICIIVLGRLIAYDHVWGSWSPATKA